MPILGYVLILILCLIIYGLWCGILALFSYAVPHPFPTILTVFVFYRLLLGFCRRASFPGSTWMWKRNLEEDFQMLFAARYEIDINELKKLMYYIQQCAITHENFSVIEHQKIAKTFNSLRTVFEKRVAQKNLNKKQKMVIEEFDKLDQALRSTNLVEKTSGAKISMWELLIDNERHVKIARLFEGLREGFSFELEDNEKGALIIEKCEILCTRLNNISYSNGFFAGLKRVLFEKYLFGTIDHMREELEKLYKCQFISLKGKENNIIDCALISGKQEDMIDNSNEKSEVNNKTSRPVMIICGANGGIFEYSAFESQLVELYLKLGFNVFVWNYRGFGKSTGKPDPNGLRRDGETIVDYLRENMGFRVIGCHGESIGGLVATHIARWKNLDYLCADRTFESLLSVGKALAGKGLGFVYRLITGWDDRPVQDFLESRCYKVITFDPNDEVIPYMSSLKYGITSRIVQTRLGINKGEPKRLDDKGPYRIYSPMGWIMRIRKIIYSVQIEWFAGKLDKKLRDEYGSLPKEHVEVLYKALTRLYEVFEIQKKIKFDWLVSQPMQIVPMNILDPTSQISNQANNDQMDFEPDISKMSASLTKESYDKLYDQDAQKDPELFKFLKNVFNAMREFELGGVQVKRIMKLRESQRFLAFKNFLWNLEIWGSYLPLDETLKELTPQSYRSVPDFYRSERDQLPKKTDVNISYHQNKSTMKLKHFIYRLDYIIDSESKNSKGSHYTSLRNLILEDLKLIVSVLPTIIENVNLGDNNKDDKKLLNDNSEEIELMPVTPKEGLAKPLLESQVDVEKKFGNDYSSTVGLLIPLSCGHNGDMNDLEVELYEEYVKLAGLVAK